METLNPILVVDDDAGIRELISDTLGDEGYVVISASDGVAALLMLEEWQPSLILLDLLMPLMDGDEFLRRYRELPGEHVPVVVFSASGRNRIGRTAAQAEADAFLAKPFDLDDLLGLVTRFAPMVASNGLTAGGGLTAGSGLTAA